MSQPMSDIFGLFYVVFFGAFLGAEIATRHFRPDDPGSSLSKYVWRVFLLVIFRSVYLAGAIVAIRPERLCADNGWLALGQLLWLLFLCTPVLGLQQLSYVFVPPPGFDPATPEVATKAKKYWWLLTVLCFALPCVALYVWWQFYLTQ